MEKVKSIFSYFFTRIPGTEFKYYIPFVIFIILLIVGGIAFSAYYKHRKKTDPAFKRLFQKTSTKLVLLGIMFGLLTLLRYERIPYFSMRIWLYLGILLFLWFVYHTVRVYKVDYPREKQNVHQIYQVVEKDKKIYLPNKKKRR